MSPASKHPTYNYGHTRPTRVGGWVRTQTMPKTRGSLRSDAETTSQTATRRLPASLIHMNAVRHKLWHLAVPTRRREQQRPWQLLRRVPEGAKARHHFVQARVCRIARRDVDVLLGLALAAAWGASGLGLERDTRLPGSFVYALAEGGGVGSLCQVTSDDGEELVVEYWRLDLTKAARKVGAGPVFLRERAQDRETYEADPRQFWSVDHLVGAAVGTAGGMVERRLFDFKLANTEIRLAGGKWEPAEAGTDAITKSIVEFKLEHSKTGYSRYLDMAAVTATSRLPVADTIMAYCKAAGFKMLTSVQAGESDHTGLLGGESQLARAQRARHEPPAERAQQGSVHLGLSSLGDDEDRGSASVHVGAGDRTPHAGGRRRGAGGPRLGRSPYLRIITACSTLEPY